MTADDPDNIRQSSAPKPSGGSALTRRLSDAIPDAWGGSIASSPRPIPSSPINSLPPVSRKMREQFSDWAAYTSPDRRKQAGTVLDIFRDPGPKFMVLIGAGEAELLQHRKPEWLAQGLADAIKHANCIGIPAKDTRGVIMRTLHDNYYPVEERQFIEVHPFVFVLYPELIGQLARGKRVLWITYGADKIVRNMNDPAFRDYYGLHDVTHNYAIEFAQPYGHTYGAGFPKMDMQQAYEDIQQQLAGVSDFDLAFVGAGWIGKVICHHIKTHLSKTAIDIGRMMSALSGLRNRSVFQFEQHFVVWDPGGDFAPARKMSDRMPHLPGNATPSSSLESLPPVSQMLREQFPDSPEYTLPDREKDVGIVLDIFRGPGAKFMVRCGDGELTLLRDQKPEWLARSVADAIRHADCLGLTQPGFPGNPDWRSGIIRALHANFQTQVDHIVTVDAFLFQMYPELIGRLARGRRVLWITYGADKIVCNMNDPAFRDYYGLQGIVSNGLIEVAMPAGASGGGPWPESISLEQSYTDICQHLTRARDFDLALVGAGWVGKPVCHHIKTHMGRSAVDIGAMLGAMAGLRNRTVFRSRRHFLVWDPSTTLMPEMTIVGQVVPGDRVDSKISDTDLQSRCNAVGVQLVKGTLNLAVDVEAQALNLLGEHDFEIESEQLWGRENILRFWKVELFLPSEHGWSPIPGKTFIAKHRINPGGQVRRLHVMSNIHLRDELGLNDGATVGLRRLKRET